MKFFQMFGCLAVCLGSLASVQATPISYVYSGTGTGTLGGTPFTDAAFTITGTADTTNIAAWAATPGGLQNPHLSTLINIEGLGESSITTPVHSWVGSGTIGGIGKNLGPNWITFNEPAIAGYDLANAIGPIQEDNPSNFLQFSNVATTGGTLAFTSMGTVTLTAIPVPEPVSVTFVATGLLLVAGQKRLITRD